MREAAAGLSGILDIEMNLHVKLCAGWGCRPAVPRDAEWGERFFHLTDPDGHELSFARPLLPVSVQ